jgi:hypothetical protein
MAVNTKMAFFWVVAPCSLVEVYLVVLCSLVEVYLLPDCMALQGKLLPEDSHLHHILSLLDILVMCADLLYVVCSLDVNMLFGLCQYFGY